MVGFAQVPTLILIGKGSGFGESCLLIIDENIIIIDSCVNSVTQRPVALEYLENNGLNKDNVIAVIATHWHDDHITGISVIVKECKNARFCITHIQDLHKFYTLLAIDNEKCSKGAIKHSTKEFIDSFDVIRTQGRTKPRFASIDKLLCAGKYGNTDWKLYAVSPSDETIRSFSANLIDELIKSAGDLNVRLDYKSLNDYSIALLFQIGEIKVFLGSDLEFTNITGRDWTAIIEESVLDYKEIRIFKIAHHGSENAYCEKFWIRNTSSENVISILTSYNRGISPLPTSKMLSLYSSKSNKLYLTTNSALVKKKEKDPWLRKTLAKLGKEFYIEDKSAPLGIITLEINELVKSKLEGSAFQL